MQSETGDEAQSGAAEALLRIQETATGAKEEGAVVRWQRSERVEGLEVVHKHVSGASLKPEIFRVPQNLVWEACAS